jgi:hypothetical protein
MDICTIAGIAWKLDYDDLEGKSFKIHWALCWSENGGKWAHIKTPESWNFTLPPKSGFTSEQFGASETRGLLGGVASIRLESLSEQCERAIGDVLTYAVCQMVDRCDLPPSIKIMIFGPALPKVVGRFCSLRLPDTVTIAWICPSPFPVWIAQRADELLLVPQRHSSVRGEDLKSTTYHSWEEEPLVTGFKWKKEDRDYVIQYMCNRSFEDPVTDLGLNELKGLAAQFAAESSVASGRGTWLPREIIATAGQVAIHLSDPYPSDLECKFKIPSALYAGDRLFEAGVSEQQNRREDGEFVVPWGQQVAG